MRRLPFRLLAVLCLLPLPALGNVDEGAVWEMFRGDAANRTLEAVACNGAGRLVAGGECGTLRVSDDHGATWTDVELPGIFSDIESLAWDGIRFLAAGGAEDGPAMVLVSQDGASWSPMCLLGQPGLRGIASNPAISRTVVVGDSGVAARSDAFPEWDAPRFPVADIPYSAVVWTGARFVAVGSRGLVSTSPDGLRWTRQNSGLGPDTTLAAIAWSGKSLLAVGYRLDMNPLDFGFKPVVVSSDADGEDWSIVWRPSDKKFTLDAVAWTGQCFVAAGGAGNVALFSNDSLQNDYKVPDGIPARGLCWDGGHLIAVGTGGGVMRSSAATPAQADWEVTQTPADLGGLNEIIDTGDWLLAVGVGGKVRISFGGFLPISSGATRTLHDVATTWNRDNLFAVGSGGTILESTNGGWAWRAQDSGTYRTLHGIAYLPNNLGMASFFVVAGEAGTILKGTGWRDDPWELQPSGTSEDLFDVAVGTVASDGDDDGIRFVVVGENGTILCSADGEAWQAPAVSPATENLNSVIPAGAFGSGIYGFVAVGALGAIYTTADCTHWTRRESGTSVDLRAVCRSSGQFFAVGEHGVVLSSPDAIAWSPHRIPGDISLNSIVPTGGDHLAAVGTRGEILFSGPADGFEEWIAAQGTPYGQDGPDDDPDGDGIENLLAYALGIPAFAPGNPGEDFLALPRLVKRDPSGKLVVRVLFRDWPAPDLVRIVEVTTDPASGAWNEVARFEPAQWSGSGTRGGAMLKSASTREVLFALPETYGRRSRYFARLRVEWNR